jgi:hypothetical protein
MMEKEISITLTSQDLAAANWLLVKRHWVQRWAPWIVLGVGLVFGLALVLSARHFHPDITSRKMVSIFAKGLMFALIFVGLQVFVVLRMIVRATRPEFGEADGHGVIYTSDQQSLSMTAQGRTTTFPWASFTRTVEDANWLLLCRTGTTFCAFPKSQLDASTLGALKQMFATSRKTLQP